MRSEEVLPSGPRREPNLLLFLLLQRQNREIFMPAGFAAKRRNVQIPPDKSKSRIHVFGCNPFQGGIAADRAVGVKRSTKRHRPGTEAGPATLATPRVEAESAQNIIGGALAARPARIILLADGTVHLGRWIPLRMCHRIGQILRGGKGRKYQLPGYNSSRG